MAFCKTSMPKKIRPKPAITRPNKAIWPLAMSLSRAPKAIIGNANMEMENFMPKNATIQPVLVVPILAPITTLMACVKLSTPAPTKPMAATIVAVDECTSNVIPKPDSMALNGVAVNLVSNSFKV